MKILAASIALVCPFLVILGISSASAASVSMGVPLASLYEPMPGQPRITSDGAGGAIITWVDSRRGSHGIYVQRVNANGAVQWTANGVAICSESSSQQSPQSISDGSGGAIITWADYRSGEYNIYAQRVSGAGATQWGASGITVCFESRNQQSPQIISDAAGGAIITWVDYRGGNYDIYAQRVSGVGAIRWAPSGVAICSEKHDQRYPQITSDGAGGAIIAWADYRGGNWDIYAQRVTADGAVQWTRNGVGICVGTQNQVSPQIAPDGAGGAIITWVDCRSENYDIYAQRVTADGATPWTVNGMGICTAIFDQVSPQVISDGSGGAIMTWADRRSGNWDIYAQRVSSNGAVSWPADGVGISTARQDQFSPQIASDGAGGAIITWMDSRSGNNDIFVQRVGSNGAVSWTANGVTICYERHDQRYPQIASDGARGAIIAWVDFRSGNYDIYAQRVNAGGVFWWTANGIPIRSKAQSRS